MDRHTVGYVVFPACACGLLARHRHIVVDAYFDFRTVRHGEGEAVTVVYDVFRTRKGTEDFALEFFRCAGDALFRFTRAVVYVT